jgi:hypothetical protein
MTARTQQSRQMIFIDHEFITIQRPASVHFAFWHIVSNNSILCSSTKSGGILEHFFLLACYISNELVANFHLMMPEITMIWLAMFNHECALSSLSTYLFSSSHLPSPLSHSSFFLTKTHKANYPRSQNIR